MCSVKVTLHGCDLVPTERAMLLLVNNLSAFTWPHHGEDLREALAILYIDTNKFYFFNSTNKIG